MFNHLILIAFHSSIRRLPKLVITDTDGTDREGH